MIKIKYFYFLIIFAFLLLLILFPVDTSAACKGNGQPCGGGGGACCSGYCNGSVCANPPPPSCKPNGSSCGGGGGNCCSGYCNGSVCANPCKTNGESCGGGGGNCCSGYCNGTSCATAPTPTPSNCKTNGTACAGGGGACCSGYCNGTVCANPCKANGEPASGGGGSCCSCYTNGSVCANPPPPPPPTLPPPPPTLPPPPPPVIIPTSTPTPAPALPWFKLKDASLVGNTSINNPIPVSPITPYDADDPGNRYLIDNSAGSDPGVATGQNISIGGAIVSAKNWKATGTSYAPQYTVSKFIDYVKSKKSNMVVEITSINNAEKGKINILTNSPTLTDGQLSSKRPLVLIVQGDVTLSGATINPSNQQQIIMSTGRITFNTSVREANGLYIADSLDFGTTTNQGIKIIGNLIAQSSFYNARSWINGKRPGLFIIFDPSHYLGLLNMFSTVSYDWRQIQ